MSYDLYLEVDAGGPELLVVSDHWNYTSNCSGMWAKAMPETDGLVGMEGMTGEEAAKIIEDGIRRMQADPGTYRAMNPDNGWGDFESQLEALKEWVQECKRAPKALMSVSR